MGYGSRQNAASGFPKILATRLSQLRVAVDVQHLYRTGRHAKDHGSIYTLKDGTHIAEADAATLYAGALTAWLRRRGALVLTNDPSRGILSGPYSTRNSEADVWGAQAYIACHLNAGGGTYAVFEYMGGTIGSTLAMWASRQVQHDFSVLISLGRSMAIDPAHRGAVCIEPVSRTMSAVISEPFFGDNPAQQELFALAKLTLLGESIGEGIAQWWERRAVASVA